MHVDLSEFRAAYLAEVEEHLGAVNKSLLAVDAANRAGRPSPRELRELMRLLHTIKGLSAMVGIEPIVGIAHRMETVLRAADRAGGVLDDRSLETMFEGTRAIESRVRAIANNEAVVEASSSLLSHLDAAEAAPAPVAAAQGDAPEDDELEPIVAAKLTSSEREQLTQGVAAGQHAVRVDFVPTPAKAEQGLTITSLRERLAPLGELVRVLPLTVKSDDATPGGLLFALIFLTGASLEIVADAAGVPVTDVTELLAARARSRSSIPPPPASEPEIAAFEEEEAAPEVSATQRAGVLRVDVARIDDTIDKLSGLIVTRSQLARAAGKLREAGADTRELEVILGDNARQLRDLRAAILRVRMVPISAVLDRLPLVIRGVGRSTGKQVRLVLEGTGAELDKAVAERIFPAFVHLLRNAIDHGIESPEERRLAGKPEQATIVVSSSSGNNRQIEIRIEDDGRGVDRARVAAKAGRPIAEGAAALLEALCTPGLSTRDAIDTTSGRGVGMDIVRKIIVEGLGGDLAMETFAGRGTAFIIRVPLTIAIVDSFTVRCANERFVVPVRVVEEIVELQSEDVVLGPRMTGRQTRFFARRGETVPVVELSEALGLGRLTSHSAAGQRGEGARTTPYGNQALVVRRGHDDSVAFAIDRVLGQQETVVRPLVDPLVSVVGISGSTDLGDGRATVVLDLLGLSGKIARMKEHAAWQ